MNQNYYSYDQIDFTDARIAFLSAKIEKAKDQMYYAKVPIQNGISMFEEEDSFADHVINLEEIYKDAQKAFREFKEWKESLGYSWYSKIKTREALEAFIKEQKEKQSDKPLILKGLDMWSKRVISAFDKIEKEEAKIAALERELNEITDYKRKGGVV